MKISLLLPTRNRPDNLRRLVKSVMDTVVLECPEMVSYLDDDDIQSEPVCSDLGISVLRGPRINLSDMWNKCYAAASQDSDIFMLAGDDMLFRTRGWDLQVVNAFSAFDDRLILVHGDDLWFGCTLGTHCFVHRKWIETAGYFTPPYFSAEYADTWINEVAGFIGRRIFLPFIVEHLHPEYGGKAPMDQTHVDRIERRNRDDVGTLYQSLNPRRFEDSMKLFAAIRKSAPEVYPTEEECQEITSLSPLTALKL